MWSHKILFDGKVQEFIDLKVKRTDASRNMDMHCDSQSQVANRVNIAIYLGTEAGTIYQTLGLEKQYNGYLLRNTPLAIEH